MLIYLLKVSQIVAIYASEFAEIVAIVGTLLAR